MSKQPKENADAYPHTIDSAVEIVMSKMPADMKAWMRKCDDQMTVDIELAKRMSGMWVRALLGLWGKNPKLMAQFKSSQPDSASQELLIECWKRLRAGEKPKKNSTSN